MFLKSGSTSATSTWRTSPTGCRHSNVGELPSLGPAEIFSFSMSTSPQSRLSRSSPACHYSWRCCNCAHCAMPLSSLHALCCAAWCPPTLALPCTIFYCPGLLYNFVFNMPGSLKSARFTLIRRRECSADAVGLRYNDLVSISRDAAQRPCLERSANTF